MYSKRLLQLLLLLLVAQNVVAAQYHKHVRRRLGDDGDNPDISQISVIGERHSGTNFMVRLLRTNLHQKLNITEYFCDYKHKYQATTLACPRLEETLVIVMIRNPYDWAMAMHQYCWCGGPKAAAFMASLDFKTFLQRPWLDNSPKPWTSETMRSNCSSIMQCRALKHLNFLNISSWAPHVEYVHHEDVITTEQSTSWLKGLVSRYSLALARNKLQPIHEYKQRPTALFDVEALKRRSVWFSSDFLAQNSTARDQVKLITKMMNVAVEKAVGYNPLG